MRSRLIASTITVSGAPEVTSARHPGFVNPPSLGDMTMGTGHPNVLSAIQRTLGFVTATNVKELAAAWDESSGLSRLTG